MTKSKLLGAGLAATAAMMFSQGAFAQAGGVAPEFDAGKNMVGAGIFSIPDFYGSDKYKAAGAPVIHYNFDAWGYPMYVQFIGNELRLNVSPVQDWVGGPLLRFRQRRDDDVDNEVVKRMMPVPSATEIGGFVSYNLPLDANPQHKVVFTGDVTWNTTGVYNGATGNLKATYFHPFEGGVGGYPLLGAVGFGLFFASDHFMDKYFGVRGSDLLLYPERGGVPYIAKSGLASIKIPFMLSSQVDKNWNVMVAGRYEHLMEDAKDSPIVKQHGSDSQWTIGIAAAYVF
jgi:outer membrane scaffolding protein for murein synthesis (MipA/OmpV family)